MILLSLGFAGLALRPVQAAVDFTVSPTTISNTFPGTITVTITGLDSGQGVRLSKFLDANANGQIDIGEPLVAHFGLRDGQAMTIGGVRFRTVPGDEDGATNGVVRAEFPLAARGELEGLVAQYLYRVSHSTNAFSPVVKPFAVTPFDFGQACSGTILSGSTPVPAAGVVALAGPDGEFLTGVIADSQGQYSLSLPTGTYQLIVVRDGYVCSLSEMPRIDLGAGQTLATNLPLIPATHTISGQLTVAQTTNGLPGFQAFCESSSGESGEFTLGFTGTNGTFSIGVTSGTWEIEPAETVVSAHGLLFPENPVEVDTSTGSVSGLVFELPPATALVYGSAKDSQNHPLPAGFSVYCGNQGLPFAGSGMTDPNGEFFVGAMAGDWWVGFDDQALAVAGFILQSTNVTLTNDQALRLDFVARQATAHLRGFVRRPDGSPLPDQSITAWSNDGFSSNRTGEDGSFDLPVFAGDWTVQLEDYEARAAGVISPWLNLTVTDGVDINGILVIARPITARITGRVATTGGMPLVSLWVSAQADFGTNHFDFGMNTDGNGDYALDVADGTWTVNLDCNDLQNRGYSCPSWVSVVVAGADQVRNFTVDTTPTRPSLGSPTLSSGTFHFTVSGQMGRSYRVWSTTDLGSWTDRGIYLGPSFDFSEPLLAGSYRFYRVEVVE